MKSPYGVDDLAVERARARDTRPGSEADAAAKLIELSSNLWRAPTLRDGLDDVLGAAVELLGADMGNVQLLDSTRGVLVIVAQRGFSQEFLEFFREVSADDDSACGRALRSGEQVIVEDVGTDPTFAPMRDVCRGAGYRAVQCTPLIGRDGALLGVLSTQFRAVHRPSEQALRLLDLYVRQAADFVERRRVEEALRIELEGVEQLQHVSVQFARSEDSEQLYEAILDAAVTIMRADFASLQMLHPERGELRLLAHRGYSPEAAAAWEWIRADHPTTCGRAFRTGTRSVVTDVERCEWMAGTEDLEHYRQTGVRSLQSTPLVSRSGSILGMISTCWRQRHQPTEHDERLLDVLARQAADWIERLKAEEALRLSDESLRQADRRKDEYLAMLSHELRNPLAAARNAIQVLLGSDGDSLTARSAIEILDRQVRHMMRQVDDLLDASAISRGKIELRKERTELAQVVNRAVEAIQPLCGSAGFELSVTLPPSPVYVDGDPIRLTQVVDNLLSNACKFTDSGGRIDLTLEQDGEEAVIRVRDTGIGIAAEEIPRIFEVFAQVDRSVNRARDGLGVGLALVKNLVEMHGGTVEARSAGLGLGSEFIVRLPATRGPLTTPARRASGVEGPESVPLRILVVDDNVDAADSLAMLLNVMGHEVEIAHDGHEGVAKAAQFLPDVVLMDIGMPRLNGYEAARRIREQHAERQPKLVALTGWGQDELRRRSKDAGFDAHVVKPANLSALTELLSVWEIS